MDKSKLVGALLAVLALSFLFAGASLADGPECPVPLVERQRYGFVRMAALHGYNITPFGLVGPDDWFDHVVEGKDVVANPWVRRVRFPMPPGNGMAVNGTSSKCP